ncbi:MAG: hypothetical protein A3F74_25665 [Betaproteobacteria bacterium RIFCSPLOWO2_12_FULL_62_58]|nr:MAG: hypothetical protein A3F74_25665 [Betaproteobacteria bacterium RIFCSPLOWO2_12_FULL_62_58]
MVVSGVQRETARILGIVSLCVVIPGALAAGYPDRPVRLIVPSPPGGGTDTATRMIAPKLSEYLGQQIVIDNRGGASGNIGAELAARAAPDGYTLVAAIASLTSNPALMKKVPYDLERDFAPISMLKMIHVPYKGAGPMLIDVVAGHVPVTAANILSTLPLVKSGRVRAYGVTSAKRASGAPDIPTIAEAGVPGYEAVTWFGLLAPAGTPREIVSRLHADVVRALQDPAVKKRFIDDGAEPTPSGSPEEFAALIRAEIAKWARVIRDAGIKPE